MKHEHRHLPIVYTTHAERRMLQRKISAYEVETMVRAGARRPDGIDKWIAFGSILGQQVQVPYVVTTNQAGERVILVLTVHD